MLEAGGEDLSNHETFWEFICKEIIRLVIEEVPQLFGFEGGMMQNSDSKLILFLVIHSNNIYYC